ncbi:MAG: phospholipase C accessory protein PlcR, partial [Burkholderia sp.]|nr:phospholipase C accessory protein PlcR [Burkholderia sp.]
MKKNRAFWRRAGAIVTIGVAVAIWRYEAATPAEAASSGTPAAMAGTQPVAADAFGTGATTPGPEERRLDVDALRRSLAGRPDADAEVKRIVAFARFR